MEASLLSQQAKSIECPYCGQSIEVLVDTSIENQDYMEDCQVCCRPITLKVVVNYSDPHNPESSVQALHENEY